MRIWKKLFAMRRIEDINFKRKYLHKRMREYVGQGNCSGVSVSYMQGKFSLTNNNSLFVFNMMHSKTCWNIAKI